jgi:DNA-binding transcriptional ArsR family regulator
MRGMLNSDALEHYSAIFAAMSEPVRMDILLRIADTPELACTVLDETLPISKSTISYHIKILYQAGLIEVRKEGRYYFYRLRPDVMEKLAPGLLERMLQARVGKPARRVAAPSFAAV